MNSSDIKFSKLVVLINAGVPAVMLVRDYLNAELGANPLEFVTHTTGTLTLVFLLITLALTPLRKILGLPWMIQLRRTLGLYAFFYGTAHLAAYVWFDKFFGFRAIVSDVGKRPFIALGMTGYLLMVPLAVTSTNAMVKRLGGKRWNLLHRAVYPAAIAGVLHYYLLVKADTRIPVGFAIALGVLLGYRLISRLFKKYQTGLKPEGPYRA
jgi:sulfoxide reductase heme-binding subunit YedZ